MFETPAIFVCTLTILDFESVTELVKHGTGTRIWCKLLPILDVSYHYQPHTSTFSNQQQEGPTYEHLRSHRCVIARQVQTLF